jgi:hypothetical protein
MISTRRICNKWQKAWPLVLAAIVLAGLSWPTTAGA